MLKVINDQMRADGRSPNEFRRAITEPRGKAVYIGMAEKCRRSITGTT